MLGNKVAAAGRKVPYVSSQDIPSQSHDILRIERRAANRRILPASKFAGVPMPYLPCVPYVNGYLQSTNAPVIQEDKRIRGQTDGRSLTSPPIIVIYQSFSLSCAALESQQSCVSTDARAGGKDPKIGIHRIQYGISQKIRAQLVQSRSPCFRILLASSDFRRYPETNNPI